MVPISWPDRLKNVVTEVTLYILLVSNLVVVSVVRLVLLTWLVVSVIPLVKASTVCRWLASVVPC